MTCDNYIEVKVLAVEENHLAIVETDVVNPLVSSSLSSRIELHLFVKFKVGKENPELQKIVELIPSIYHRGQKIAVKEPIDPASLLPGMCQVNKS
jgi:carbonic anhydrase